MAYNWTCPYCNRPQTVTAQTEADVNGWFDTVATKFGKIYIECGLVACVNPECLSPSIEAEIYASEFSGYEGKWKKKGKLKSWRLLPSSHAKPLPEFIPQALREDYQEACLIRDLSPKSSATLSRRCLQGMIRDFCAVAEGTLAKEIDKVRTMVAEGKAPQGVSPESIDAIDHVRSVGNIGAHMEKNIDHIVPVEPHEAQMLIELIETLFEEWYVARDRRARRFASVKAIADDKKAMIAALKAPQIEGPKED